MADIPNLVERLETATGRCNATDVLVEIALFEPCDIWKRCRANSAGTKVIYTDALGEQTTCWAREWTDDRSAAIALITKHQTEKVDAPPDP